MRQSRDFPFPEIILCAFSLLAVFAAFYFPIKGKIAQDKSSQAQKLLQEEKNKLLQERANVRAKEAQARAEQRRAEQLQKEQEEIERLNLIEKEKLQQEILQKEYAPVIQPLSFTITPWQYNREQEFSVFVLYDINNKQEYLVVKTGLGTPNPSVSITPRYKNLNP
jgi:hypothetical protein